MYDVPNLILFLLKKKNIERREGNQMLCITFIVEHTDEQKCKVIH